MLPLRIVLVMIASGAIGNFIDWADLDTYAICPVDEWDADDWGKKVGEF